MGKMFPTLPGVYQNGWVYQNVDGGPINPTISLTPTDLSMSNEISFFFFFFFFLFDNFTDALCSSSYTMVGDG